jgi:hypothetical protein
MKIDCNIIQDILPLYAENIASDETKSFVEEHIADCGNCRSLLDGMKTTPDISATLSAVPLAHLKKELSRKRVATVLMTVAAVLAIVITVLAFLTTPQYVPYSDDVLSITEINGVLICTYNDRVTGSESYSYLSEDGETDTYHLTAWQTVLHRYTGYNRGLQEIIIPVEGRQVTIYYNQNDGTEDVLIYGKAPNGVDFIVTLPRLAPGYYFTIAIVAAFVLSMLLLIFRKKRAVKLWIERILLFPVSYIIGHLCIMGVKGLKVRSLSISYSAPRDFVFILLVTVLIYLVCFFGINALRARKER